MQPLTLVSQNEQQLLNTHQIQVQIDVTSKCGVIIFGQRQLKVKLLSQISANEWQPVTLQEQQLKETASKVALMLIKKELLNNQHNYSKFEILDSGILVRDQHKVISHDEQGSKNTRADYDTLMAYLARQTLEEVELDESTENNRRDGQLETEILLEDSPPLAQKQAPLVIQIEEEKEEKKEKAKKPPVFSPYLWPNLFNNSFGFNQPSFTPSFFPSFSWKPSKPSFPKRKALLPSHTQPVNQQTPNLHKAIVSPDHQSELLYKHWKKMPSNFPFFTPFNPGLSVTPFNWFRTPINLRLPPKSVKVEQQMQNMISQTLNPFL